LAPTAEIILHVISLPEFQLPLATQGLAPFLATMFVIWLADTLKFTSIAFPLGHNIGFIFSKSIVLENDVELLKPFTETVKLNIKVL